MKKLVGLMALLLLVVPASQAQQEKVEKKEEHQREAHVVEKRVHIIKKGEEAPEEGEMKWHTDDDRVIILKDGDDEAHAEAQDVDVEVHVEGLEDGTRIMLIRKVADGEERVIKLKMKGDELPEDVQELLDREGIDLIWLDGKGDDFGYELRVDEEDEDRPMLGVMVGEREIEDVDEVYEDEDAAEGVVVLDLIEGSPAEAAGLRKGDVIVELDGASVQDYRELVERLASHQAGDTVHLAWLRDGQRMEADVTLAPGKALELEKIEEHRVIRKHGHDVDGPAKGKKKKVRKIIIIEEEH